MIKTAKIFLFIPVLLLYTDMLWSQPELSPGDLQEVVRFYVDVLSFKSTESGVSRLDVYVEIPYEALQFVKSGDVFQANYEITINIFDTLETLVTEKWWHEKIEVKDYNQAASHSISNLNHRSFSLVPGSYILSVQLKDRETNNISRVKKKVYVRKYFDTPFSLSDIMLASRLDIDSTGKTNVYPNISGNIGNLRDTFYLFYEAYNSVSADSAVMIMNIYNVKGGVVKSDTFAQQLGVDQRPCFRKITTSELVAGDYIVQIHATVRKSRVDLAPEQKSAISSRSFIVHWRGMPISINDLDLAIDELQYITDRDQIEEMRKAPLDRKRSLFEEFWKKRDPSPNNERNEMMEEYYSRVAYANKHFGHYVEGWKTDMGMVYIIFGSPSNIERHPFDSDSRPYEIWTYFDISREFVFVDVTGFGDYRLQNPMWDLRQTRPRTR